MGFRTQRDKRERRERRGENGHYLTALDLGSRHLRLASGIVDAEGQVQLIGYAEYPSAGINRGAITDIGLLSKALTALFNNYMTTFEHLRPQHLIVGVPGQFVQMHTLQGNTTVSSGVVTESDRDRAIENARAGTNHDSEQAIIHVLPQNFITPTSPDVTNPIGQYARRLDVTAVVITCRLAHMMNLRQVVGNVSGDLDISHFVYNGLAAADAVLTPGDRDMGVMHLNFGAGGLDVSYYRSGHLVHTLGFANGGELITEDVAMTFGLERNLAEYIKYWGLADPQLFDQYPDEPRRLLLQNGPEGPQLLKLPNGQDVSSAAQGQIIDRVALSTVIHDRLQEIIQAVIGRLQNRQQQTSGNQVFATSPNFMMGAGLVVSGGVACTQGLETVIGKEFSSPFVPYDSHRSYRVSCGVPRGVTTELFDNSALNRPQLATLIGLLRRGQLELNEDRRQMQLNGAQKRPGFFAQLREWAKKEF